MIKVVSGDFFEVDADIMVNTVNCVGVMGAGVALAFRKKFPDMFVDYIEKCKAGEIRPGHPSVWMTKIGQAKPLEIINFPTKNDWKKPSQYSYIEDGLSWLKSYLLGKEGKVVTLPALGCGHGGLEWDRVRQMIFDALQDSPAKIHVFEPSSSHAAGKQKSSHSDLLRKAEIEVLKSSSRKYPAALNHITSRDLFYYPSDRPLLSYDFSLVCSTKPSDLEASLISQFADLCVVHKKSLLLGASAFEKKLAVKLVSEGADCACVLPSGIYESVTKIKLRSAEVKPRLLSQGDPFKAFDKKEFLPAVLLRMHLGRKCLFLTHRLSWISRFKELLELGDIELYYYNWPDMQDEDQRAISDAKGRKVGPEFLTATFQENTLLNFSV